LKNSLFFLTIINLALLNQNINQMKKIKLFALALFSMFLLTNFAQAQNIKQEQVSSKEVNKQARVDEKQLNLLTGQQEPYREIIKKHDKKQQEILDSYPNKNEQDAKLREAENERNKELKNLLSEEQYNKYLELDAENKKVVAKEPKNEPQ
jgi:type III secretory pathway component EscR